MPVFGDLPGDNGYLDVISKLNQGLLCQAKWLEALEAMAKFVGADDTYCLAWDKETDSISVIESCGLSEEASRAYSERFQYLDPGRVVLQDAPLGKIFIDCLAGTNIASQNDEFHRDFLRPNDISSYMVMIVERQEPIEWMISFGRRWGRPYFEDYNAESMHRLLQPLRTAVRVRLKLQALENAQKWSLQVLDHVSLPLLVVDDRGTVQLANSAGSQWMERPDFPLNSQKALEVLRIVREACGHCGAQPRTSYLTLSAGNGRPHMLLALPIAESLPQAASSVRRVALLLEVGSQARALPQRELLRQMFRLTPAEISLTSQLARGLTLAEAAEENSVTRETARTHLKSVLRKTGTHRQSELIALLSGMSMVNL